MAESRADFKSHEFVWTQIRGILALERAATPPSARNHLEVARERYSGVVGLR